jgi:hypothetical protein
MQLDLAAAAFWLFLAAVVTSLIWRKALQRREVLITLRAAIDKGLPLDDKRLQLLVELSSRPQRVSRDFFLVFGVILGAAALCMLILAWFAQDRGLLLFLGLSGAIMAGALVFLWRLFAWLARRDGAAHE